LSYSEYAPVLAGSCSQLVYDKPRTTTILNDYFACTADLIKQTYTLAGQEYDLYITQKRIEFRNAYVSKCLSNQASANIEGDKQNTIIPCIIMTRAKFGQDDPAGGSSSPSPTTR